MDNLKLARFLAICMYKLACMVVFLLLGKTDDAAKCEDYFKNQIELLDAIERVTESEDENDEE